MLQLLVLVTFSLQKTVISFLEKIVKKWNLKQYVERKQDVVIQL